MKLVFSVTMAVMMAGGSTHASDAEVKMHIATTGGPGKLAGTVVITASDQGAVFTVKLGDMKPLSRHGFHVHANGDCGPAAKNGKVVPALAAGGHWDPENTGKHQGWQGEGHLGDLPQLQADNEGRISALVTAPRITNVDRLKGRALMLHANGDNYADTPKKLGGGGARLLCGVIE